MPHSVAKKQTNSNNSNFWPSGTTVLHSDQWSWRLEGSPFFPCPWASAFQREPASYRMCGGIYLFLTLYFVLGYSQSWMVLWRPLKPSRTNTQKRCPLHYRELECKSRKSRDTWGNRQIWPWSTEWSRAKANTVLPREFTGHSKHPLPTTQEKTLHMDITRWSIQKSDWL